MKINVFETPAGRAGSNQQWTWHPDFRRRWHLRRQYNIDNLVKIHIKQSYQDAVELPEMKPVEQMEMQVQWSRSGKKFRQPQAYEHLHTKLQMHSSKTGNHE